MDNKKNPQTEGSDDSLICKTNRLRFVESIPERIMLLKILSGYPGTQNKRQASSLSSKLHRSFYEYLVMGLGFYYLSCIFATCQRRLLFGIQQSPAFKVGRFHIVLLRMQFARIQGRNPFVRNIYIRGGQGNYNSTLGHPRWT